MVQSPKTPESKKYEKNYEKNTKSPTLGRPKKIRKKYPKNTKMAENCLFVFFRYFFRIFGGDLGSGIVYFFSNFFVFPGFSGFFGLCTTPAGP